MLERHDFLRPFILCLSGILGAAGVALAAAASHGGDTHLLGSASTMCLAHAPVLLALYLAHRAFATATLSGVVLAAGTVVFASDLLARHFLGTRLFAFAAPTGGMMMMLGWICIAAGAFFHRSG